MPRFKAPCARCGELTRSHLCETCTKTDERRRIREHTKQPTKPPEQRGYDHNWRKLSERARRLQPWCTMCGTRDNLTADHTPEAWQRVNAGKPIGLEHVDVLCQSCNVKAGAARGNNVTRPYKRPTVQQQANHPHSHPKRSQSHTDTLGGMGKPTTGLLPPGHDCLDDLMRMNVVKGSGFGGGSW